MGRHHDRGPGAIDAIEDPHDAHRRRRIEVPGRLVGEDNEGTVHERPGDRDTLLLATRKLTGIAVGFGGQPHQLEDLGHLIAHDVAGAPGDFEGKRHVLVHGLVRQQFEVLEHRADRAPQMRHLPGREIGSMLAGDPDVTVGGAFLTHHEPNERGLARARRADEEDELTLGDIEAHVFGGHDAAVVDLRDVLETDHGFPSEHETCDDARDSLVGAPPPPASMLPLRGT